MARSVLTGGGTVSKAAVTVVNRDGRRMYGILTTPAKGAAGTKAIVLCHAGVTSKAGTGEYMRLLADQLAADGHSVLRFDQSGVGDSEGEIGNGIPINRYYRMIQTGLSTADTEDAVAWLARTCDPSGIWLLGHCGGCITATLVAARHRDVVHGLIFIALPVLYSPVNEERSPGRTDLVLMTRTVASYGAERLRKWTHRVPPERPALLHPLFNRSFGEAFEELMKRGTRVLLIMPELDGETDTFESEFQAKVLDRKPEYAALCRVEYLPNTDHSLMFESSRARLKSVISAGLGAMARA